ncbi:Eco57I restriction-modification methylase domain-containing protein [Thermosporothrix hazakensis]|uniref:Eco57I restriction-modification methylase domain-containing protein n=1 Tax=Thermosporothrix hazakensis TaxID=644383 RepID=UPI001472AF23|nr:TaqI-like C-terminal specificity domain-containing protein [Thermosporothrix hazakensis]
MLILTNDYEILEFLFLMFRADVVQHDQEGNQVYIGGVPRSFQIKRSALDDVSFRLLQMLRRHEGEDVTSYADRLYTIYETAYWSKEYFNNRSLFSDYYLEYRLPEETAWRETREGARSRTFGRTFTNFCRLYDEARETCQGKPVGVLQQALIRPILELLGFDVEEKPASGQSHPPFYLLYRKDAAGNRITPAVAFCLAYAWERNLDRPQGDLDSLYDVEQDPERRLDNPGAAVVSLFEQSDETGEIPWGILTNGVQWRLYSAQAHSRSTNYLEVYPDEIARMQPLDPTEAFRYFWFLFRAASFRPAVTTLDEQDTITLEKIFRESGLYAHTLEEQLKNRIFEEVFPHLAQGFLEYGKQHGLYPAQPETLPAHQQEQILKAIFDGTLTFLYRLLFLFYAESRQLLPIEKPNDETTEETNYYRLSINKLKLSIASVAGIQEEKAPGTIRAYYDDHSTEMYERLQELFKAIDGGSVELNVPLYNGGLFLTKPDEAGTPAEAEVVRFLNTLKIPDRYLALGLDRLARVEDEKAAKLIPVDYKTLGVRQLGSIYEGLLEFSLQLATQPMVVVRERKKREQKELLISLEEARRTHKHPIQLRPGTSQVIYQPGDIYLINDKRERKTSGSYYTPDYVVKYIAEETIGKLLDDKLNQLLPRFRDLQLELRHQREIMRELSPETQNEAKAEEAAYQLPEAQALIEDFFDFKVLDPSMGSGHFLVEAVDLITDRMVKYLDRFAWNPVMHHLQKMRKDIRDEVERQGVKIDETKLTDINLLKRQVLKRCIYGVDINPMAVELAKVSLWLDSFTLGAPLSFLDHHLRCGNSLMGAWLDQAQSDITALAPRSLFYSTVEWKNDIPEATGNALAVAHLSDVTKEQVQQSKAKHKDAERALLPFKRQMHVYLSRWSRNKSGSKRQKAKQENKEQNVALDFLRNAVSKEWSRDNTLTLLDEEQQQVVANALADAQEYRFFHWELEFPEAFFEITQENGKQKARFKQDGGFDVVIGNPPYVRQERLGSLKDVLQHLYSVYNGTADLSTYFIELGHLLLHQNGRFGMITSNKFMRANYGKEIRAYLANDPVYVDKLIDFGDLPVFGDATTYPLILLTRKAKRTGTPTTYTKVTRLQFNQLPKLSLSTVLEGSLVELPEDALKSANWSLANKDGESVLQKIKACSVPLKEYLPNKIYYGIKTGCNEAFVINQETRDRLIAQDPASAEIIKPLLEGEDINRYEIEFKQQYLIFTRGEFKLSKYKAIREYLEQFRERLEPRPRDWDPRKAGKWNGRAPGSYQWFELQSTTAYYAEFEKPKIIFPDMANKGSFTLSTNGEYALNTAYMICSSSLSLLALLNSSLIEFFYRDKAALYRGGYLRFFAQYINETPIRKIKDVTPEVERYAALAEARQLYEAYLKREAIEMDDLLAFVDFHLSKKPEAADVIRDLLAFLAEQMLVFNKQKQQAQKDFLSWLERTIRIMPDRQGRTGLASLAKKDKLLNYPGEYQERDVKLSAEGLIDTLKKNKARLAAWPRFASLQGEIIAEYEKSLETILPLKKQLRRTDALIDQIVYRLYGLTDEEIAVIEAETGKEVEG